MKKIFLTVIALLTVASMQVFGMYGATSRDWITFLTDGNRFEAKLDQLGFTLGNDTIKGTFGFHEDRGMWGAMLKPTNGTPTGSTVAANDFFYNFVPTISMGLGYTSSLISVGVGYNATIGPVWNRYNGKTESKKVEAVVHTPVLVLNALDNAFRMAIPIQVVNLTEKFDGYGKGSVTAVSFDAQFRYYTGIEALTQVRLYLKYGTYGMNFTPDQGDKVKEKFAESFGFDLRFYFGSMVEEVALQPIVRLAYNGALGKQHNKTAVTALSALDDSAGVWGTAYNNTVNSATAPLSSYSTGTAWEQSAWDLLLMTGLGLTANSDIVSLYLEPQLGLKVVQSGSALEKIKEAYGLGYNVYAEIYITPIKNLEWYFEAEIGNALKNTSASTVSDGFQFNGTTGVTWYLPQL
ncbi:cell surface protein [Brachyspira sp.]|uniref:cell surface protein n=1 Tax=Brachyspira sp. TaxID=1977261 RepID=UPI003D7D2828